MSVWKKIKSDVLASGVKKDLFIESLKEIGITLDESVKKVKNAWGHDTCDAAIVKDNKTTALGIKFNSDNGVELIGDIYGSGLGRDGTQEQLMDKIAYHYQVYNIKDKLQHTNWFIEDEYKENGQTVIKIAQY